RQLPEPLPPWPTQPPRHRSQSQNPVPFYPPQLQDEPVSTGPAPARWPSRMTSTLAQPPPPGPRHGLAAPLAPEDQTDTATDPGILRALCGQPDPGSVSFSGVG